MGDWSMNESVKIGDKVRLIGYSEDAGGVRFPGVVGKIGIISSTDSADSSEQSPDIVVFGDEGDLIKNYDYEIIKRR